MGLQFAPFSRSLHFIGLFAGAIWLTFLYNSTGGSILTVAVWHTVWNIVNIFGAVVSTDIVALMSAMVMVAAVVVATVWGRAHLSAAHGAGSSSG